jgi:glycosyltransferase involved in cell wall biosynthesis
VLSVVIPIYNEAESVPILLDRLHDTLGELGRPYELIAVDDGSRDDTFGRLRTLAAQDARLRVVRFRRNFGQTAAFVAGFDRARGQVIITLDADLQNDPRDIPQLLAKLDEGFDVVSGWRVQRQDPFWQRRFPSMLANRLIGAATGVRLHDFGCSLKAYRRDVLADLPLYGELHRLIPAVASWQGVEVAEVPVRHHPRQYGRSKYGIGRTVRVLLDILTVRFFLTHGTRPMHVFGTIGLLMGAVGVVLLSYLAFVKLVRAQSIGDRPLLLLGVLLSVMAVQFLSLGLLGEMLVRSGPLGKRAVYRVRDELNAPTGGDER